MVVEQQNRKDYCARTFYDQLAESSQAQKKLFRKSLRGPIGAQALGPVTLLTRRERLKSAPYLRLKKRKTIFWKKT